MTLHDFLEEVCRHIKYRSIHNDIRDELASHIYEIKEREGFTTEQAVAMMGDPAEIGKNINKAYRMPFNCRYGIEIWAAAAAAPVCIAYPFLKALSGTNIGFAAMLIIIAAYGLLCGFIIRRSNVRLTLRDILSAAVGGLCGTVITLAVVYLVSLMFTNGVYPYYPNVRIPFGIKLTAAIFAVIMMMWSAFVYFCSCKAPSNKRFGGHVPVDGGTVVYDDDIIVIPNITGGTAWIHGKYSDELRKLKKR